MEPGIKLRCGEPRVDPGGGGINVARVITRLGGRCAALAVVGGATGERLISLLQAEGIAADTIRIPAETRESLAVTDASNGEQFRFILPGPTVSDEMSDQIQAEIAEIAADMGSKALVVLSGSFLPGITPDFAARCAALLRPKGHRLCIDTSGAALRQLVQHSADGLFLLRFDQSEATQISGQQLYGAADTAAFAAALVQRSVADIVVIGCGAEGSVLATADACHFCAAAKVPVVSTTGAGDSFMGAIVHSLAYGDPSAKALQWGVAAASAAVMTPATELCDAGMVRKLLDQCSVSSV